MLGPEREQVLRLVAVLPLHEEVSSFLVAKEVQNRSGYSLRI
jgi:hypothetical protein